MTPTPSILPEPTQLEFCNAPDMKANGGPINHQSSGMKCEYMHKRHYCISNAHTMPTSRVKLVQLAAEIITHTCKFIWSGARWKQGSCASTGLAGREGRRETQQHSTNNSLDACLASSVQADRIGWVLQPRCQFCCSRLTLFCVSLLEPECVCVCVCVFFRCCCFCCVLLLCIVCGV